MEEKVERIVSCLRIIEKEFDRLRFQPESIEEANDVANLVSVTLELVSSLTGA